MFDVFEVPNSKISQSAYAPNPNIRGKRYFRSFGQTKIDNSPDVSWRQSSMDARLDLMKLRFPNSMTVGGAVNTEIS